MDRETVCFESEPPGLLFSGSANGSDKFRDLPHAFFVQKLDECGTYDGSLSKLCGCLVGFRIADTEANDLRIF